jgi:hypothetical protein
LLIIGERLAARLKTAEQTKEENSKNLQQQLDIAKGIYLFI